MLRDTLAYTAEILAKSGGIGLFILFLLFICIGVGLERTLFWTRFWGLRRALVLGRARSGDKNQNTVEERIRNGQFEQAGVEARRAASPVLRLLAAALSRLRSPEAWPSVREHTLAETLGGNVIQGRRFLITAIQVFGLLGMLGTCKGLYTQLSGFAPSMTDVASLQGAMGGMAEAFTTTLVGLAAAGLTTLIYLPNESAIERFRRELVRVDQRIQAALADGRKEASHERWHAAKAS